MGSVKSKFADEFTDLLNQMNDEMETTRFVVSDDNIDLDTLWNNEWETIANSRVLGNDFDSLDVMVLNFADELEYQADGGDDYSEYLWNTGYENDGYLRNEIDDDEWNNYTYKDYVKLVKKFYGKNAIIMSEDEFENASYDNLIYNDIVNMDGEDVDVMSEEEFNEWSDLRNETIHSVADLLKNKISDSNNLKNNDMRKRIKDSNDYEMFSDLLNKVYEDTKTNETLFPMLISTTQMGDKVDVIFEALTHPADMDIVMECETSITSYDEMVANIVADMREQVNYVSENNEQVAEDWSAETGDDVEDCIDNNYKYIEIYTNLADYIESIG